MLMSRKRSRPFGVERLESRRHLSRVIYVDASASGGASDGTSWADAYADLQQGLASAVAGDDIRVADGVYKPTASTDRAVSFTLKSGVALRGGYAGHGAADPNARDLATYASILSGNVGNAASSLDNSYHVVIGSGVDSTAVLDGFTITQGAANNSTSPQDRGGGMYNVGGSPMVLNCTFSNNSAGRIRPGYGGAVYNASDASTTFRNCSFVDNAVEGIGKGGAVYNYQAAPAFFDCTFSGNRMLSTYVSSSSIGDGGAIYSGGVPSPVTLTRCLFANNIATYGGALFAAGRHDLIECRFIDNTTTGENGSGNGGAIYGSALAGTIANCTFIRNSAKYAGGAIVSYQGSPFITNCSFNGNKASTYGGAIYFRSPSSPVLANCTFCGNRGGYGGAVGSSNGGAWSVANCTFRNNVATAQGGAIYCSVDSSVRLDNSVLWENTDATGSQIHQDAATIPLAVTHSDIQGGFAGAGNINADPLFVRAPSPGGDGVWGTSDDDYGDLRLQMHSPCIDAGDNSAVPGGVTTDLAGAARFFDVLGVKSPGTIVDMGAYEFGSPLGGWVIPASRTLTLAAGGRSYVLTQLVIETGGALDLADNDLVLDYSAVSPVGIWTGSAYDGLTGMIKSGRIISSAASGTLKTLGVAEARDALNITGSQTATFSGQVVDSTAVLVKFTWGGDANLDGKLNIDDYGRIDSNVAQSGSVWGWFNGDFNYDGAINIDDYGIIDSNIGAQGDPFLAAGSATTAAVPSSSAELRIHAPALVWSSFPAISDDEEERVWALDRPVDDL